VPRLRRIYNVVGAIGSGSTSGVVGGADEWVEKLSQWATELDFDTSIFWPTPAPRSQLGEECHSASSPLRSV